MSNLARAPFGIFNVNTCMESLRISIAIMFCLLIAAAPEYGHAAINFNITASFLGYPVGMPNPPPDPILLAMQNILATFTGTMGKAICTVAVIAAGIAALFHRISWVQVLLVTLGVGIVFGASSILYNITGGSTDGVHPDSGVGVCDNILTSDAVNISLNRPCEAIRVMVDKIQSGTGNAIATMAVILLGVGALFGKITYPQAFALTLGIGLVFGSVSIVQLIWNPAGNCMLNDAVNSLISFFTGNEVNFILCRFMNELHGDTAKLLATLAIIVMGFLALMGRLSLTVALVTAVGISTAFGAETIIDWLVPNAYNCHSFGVFNANLGSGAIQGVLCQILQLINGTPGKALATASVIMLGFGAMLGKVSFGSALIVATGIAIAFGAPQIVFILTGMIDQCGLSVSLGGSYDLCSGNFTAAPR